MSVRRVFQASSARPKGWRTDLRRLAYGLLLAFLGLQVFFALRILTWRWINPSSSSFERTQFFRQVASDPWSSSSWQWQQEWVDLNHVSIHVPRALIASEDAHFAEHEGVDWDALEKAWEKNEAAQDKQTKQASRPGPKAQSTKPMKWQGGSTLTQQLAKNLFLSGERSLIRKAQELIITFMLEALLNKERILEIYLNHAEWGQGIFGIEAAAQFYTHRHASQLTAVEAARLVVMLPRPRYYQQHPHTLYLQKRTQTITQRMESAVLPEPVREAAPVYTHSKNHAHSRH
jgi:monofunctional biosynthetic peptidoglycan transglycosylase